jgi:urease accessory protein
MRSLALAAAAISVFAAPAFAHTGHEHAMLEGFGAGFLHPLGGLDHLLAMIAVGVWAAQQGGRAVWLVPLAFVGTMAAGGAIGLLGSTIGGTETVIIASVLVLGAVVAAALKPSLWLAVPLVGAFALFHGLAHGRELPEAADAFGYSLGFVAATALLHAAGIGLAFAMRGANAALALRAAGAATVGAGVLLAAGAI